MEEFQKSAARAKQTIKVADHMLIMTFPMVKDPKLLLAVLDNIFSSFSYSIDALVSYERLFKRVPPYQENFESKFNIFRDKLVTKHNINKEYIRTIAEIQEILKEHKKSPMEFSRGDKFVICSGNYRMKTIGVLELKKFIAQAKLFGSDIERLLEKDAGIFK